MPSDVVKSLGVDPNEMDSSFIGLTGGQIFHEMMRRHSVEKVFGYPGGVRLDDVTAAAALHDTD